MPRSGGEIQADATISRRAAIRSALQRGVEPVRKYRREMAAVVDRKSSWGDAPARGIDKTPTGRSNATRHMYNKKLKVLGVKVTECSTLFSERNKDNGPKPRWQQPPTRISTAAADSRPTALLITIPGIYVRGLQPVPPSLSCSTASLQSRPPEFAAPSTDLYQPVSNAPTPTIFYCNSHRGRGDIKSEEGGIGVDSTANVMLSTPSTSPATTANNWVRRCGLLGSFTPGLRRRRSEEMDNVIFSRESAAKEVQRFLRQRWKRSGFYNRVRGGKRRRRRSWRGGESLAGTGRCPGISGRESCHFLEQRIDRLIGYDSCTNFNNAMGYEYKQASRETSDGGADDLHGGGGNSGGGGRNCIGFVRGGEVAMPSGSAEKRKSRTVPHNNGRLPENDASGTPQPPAAVADALLDAAASKISAEARKIALTKWRTGSAGVVNSAVDGAISALKKANLMLNAPDVRRVAIAVVDSTLEQARRNFLVSWIATEVVRCVLPHFNTETCLGHNRGDQQHLLYHKRTNDGISSGTENAAARPTAMKKISERSGGQRSVSENLGGARALENGDRRVFVKVHDAEEVVHKVAGLCVEHVILTARARISVQQGIGNESVTPLSAASGIAGSTVEIMAANKAFRRDSEGDAERRGKEVEEDETKRSRSHSQHAGVFGQDNGGANDTGDASFTADGDVRRGDIAHPVPHPPRSLSIPPVDQSNSTQRDGDGSETLSPPLQYYEGRTIELFSTTSIADRTMTERQLDANVRQNTVGGARGQNLIKFLPHSHDFVSSKRQEFGTFVRITNIPGIPDEDEGQDAQRSRSAAFRIEKRAEARCRGSRLVHHAGWGWRTRGEHAQVRLRVKPRNGKEASTYGTDTVSKGSASSDQPKRQWQGTYCQISGRSPCSGQPHANHCESTTGNSGRVVTMPQHQLLGSRYKGRSTDAFTNDGGSLTSPLSGRSSHRGQEVNVAVGDGVRMEHGNGVEDRADGRGKGGCWDSAQSDSEGGFGVEIEESSETEAWGDVLGDGTGGAGQSLGSRMVEISTPAATKVNDAAVITELSEHTLCSPPRARERGRSTQRPRTQQEKRQSPNNGGRAERGVREAQVAGWSATGRLGGQNSNSIKMENKQGERLVASASSAIISCASVINGFAICCSSRERRRGRPPPLHAVLADAPDENVDGVITVQQYQQQIYHSSSVASRLAGDDQDSNGEVDERAKTLDRLDGDDEAISGLDKDSRRVGGGRLGARKVEPEVEGALRMFRWVPPKPPKEAQKRLGLVASPREVLGRVLTAGQQRPFEPQRFYGKNSLDILREQQQRMKQPVGDGRNCRDSDNRKVSNTREPPNDRCWTTSHHIAATSLLSSNSSSHAR